MSDAHVLWLGHASALVAFGHDRILIDPLGRRRSLSAAPYQTVAITHSHVDHLNRWTLKALDKSARLVVPKGARPIVDDLGFSEVIEVEPGDGVECGSTELIAVETKHDSGRWRRADSPICVGYLIQHEGIVVHHAGDVDMSTWETFDALGKKHQVHATLLPIGGMLPVWYYRLRAKKLDRGVHIDPDRALEIAERMGANCLVPVHWGTVSLRLGQGSRAPKERLVRVAESSSAQSLVRVLEHGQRLTLTTSRDGT